MPQLQHQHAPQNPRTVPPSARMFIDQGPHCFRFKVATLQSALLEQNPEIAIFHAVAHPVDQWQLKALLASMQQGGRNPESLSQLLQNKLSGAGAKFPIDWQSRHPL